MVTCDLGCLVPQVLQGPCWPSADNREAHSCVHCMTEKWSQDGYSLVMRPLTQSHCILLSPTPDCAVYSGLGLGLLADPILLSRCFSSSAINTMATLVGGLPSCLVPVLCGDQGCSVQLCTFLEGSGAVGYYFLSPGTHLSLIP